jgi:hypothetical protein
MGCTTSAEETARIKAAKAAQKPLTIFDAGTKVQEVEVNFSKSTGVTVMNKNSENNSQKESSKTPQQPPLNTTNSEKHLSSESGQKKNPFLKTTSKDYVNVEEANAPLYYATPETDALPERPSSMQFNSPVSRESSMRLKGNPLKLKTKQQEEVGELYYASTDSSKVLESESGSLTKQIAKKSNPLAKK